MLQPYESKNMFESKKYTELIEIGNDQANRDDFTIWDWSNYLKSLYNLKCYDEYLEKYKEMHRRFPDYKYADYNLCWALYYTHIQNFDFKTGNIDLYRKQTELILDKLKNTNNHVLPKKIVFEFCTAIKKGFIGESRDYSLIESYLKKINPDDLSKEEIKNTNPNAKAKASASDYEKWYSFMAGALMEQEKYDECIECCDKALATIVQFHSNNDAWFRYRKASSLRALGRSDEGMLLIKEALSGRFSHWCLYQFLFDDSVEKSNFASANIYGAKCATADRSHQMRVKFYLRYADFLENQNSIREAMLLRQLVILVRQEEGWSSKSYFANWNISDEARRMSKDDILRELNSFWKKYTDSDKFSGRIVRLIGDGNSGFVEDESGNSYYFSSKDFKAAKSKMVEGQSVKFDLADGFDNKKNKATKRAVNITL